MLRAYARYARQLGSSFGLIYVADILLANPDTVRALMALFRARFDPAVSRPGRRGRGGARRGAGPDRPGHQPGRGPHPAQLPGHDHGHAAHQLLPQPAVLLVQDRPVGGAGHAGAPAPVRDLRVLAADRGRAPAVRAGRPRRAALVGPPAGLPHRDPRAGQGAGGEERGDRAGRREGRVRGAPRRRRPGRGRVLLPDVHLRAARRHRQPGRRQRPCPPPDVVRHDGDDSYLVVAADKGTAKFSDTANDVAASYGFWLGDAFASGGSVGYDHKAMGITARGAWESVKRHFRELGVDTQTRGVHRGRRRRHVRRRVRQRDAALGAHPAARRVRPPARVRRPEPGRGPLLRRAAAAVRAAPLLLGRLRPEPDQRGRRGVAAHPEVGADRAGDPRGARAGRRRAARSARRS